MGWIDGRGREVAPVGPTGRIVSLVPSTSETVCALGGAARLVGVTRYCVRPPGLRRRVATVGGTKDPDLEGIRALAPDLVLANCEENTREAIDALETVCSVWAAFPRTVEGAVADVRATGALIGAAAAGEALADRIQGAWDRRRWRSFRYAYLIWRRPWMTISDDTFVASLVGGFGGVNAFGGHPSRFPTVTLAEIGAAEADLVLLSSEPFRFRARHAEEVAAGAGVPIERVRFVDGQACSWHGARLVEAIPALSDRFGALG